MHLLDCCDGMGEKMRPDLGFEPEFPKSLVRCSTN